MADYYPLIARAIAGLDPSAPGESRRALYERARTALIAQLRSVQPPLSESEITRERLSLEEAVRKVESEAAQRAREASRPGGGAARARRRRLPPRQCPSAGRRTPGLRPAPGAPPRPRPPGQPPARDARPPLGQEEQPRPPRNLRPDAPPPARRARSRRRFRCRMPSCRRPASDPAAPRRGPDNGAPPMPPAAGHARLPRHRRRRRRSRPRRGAGQPCGAKNLCQRAVALAGIRPARAEHGEPRRRSRGALFLRGIAGGGRPLRAAAAANAAAARAFAAVAGIATANRRSAPGRRPCSRSRARSRSASC